MKTKFQQDFDLLIQAQTRTHAILTARNTYKVAHAARVLRAAKQLNLLLQELEQIKT